MKKRNWLSAIAYSISFIMLNLIWKSEAFAFNQVKYGGPANYNLNPSEYGIEPYYPTDPEKNTLLIKFILPIIALIIIILGLTVLVKRNRKYAKKGSKAGKT